VTGTATATNSTDTKTATADCTGGRKVIGGGYLTAGTVSNDGELAPVSDRASDDDTWSVTVTGDNPGNGDTWSLQAFAICLTAGT
jgi:hypothetical protein